MCTFADRRAWARQALEVFPYAQNLQNGDVDSALADLLADLMHFCDGQDGLEFEDCLERARGFYETDEEYEDVNYG